MSINKHSPEEEDMAISKEEIIKHVIGEIHHFEFPEPVKVKVRDQIYENISEIVFTSVCGKAGFSFIHGDSEEYDLTCEEAFNLLLQNKSGEVRYAVEPFGVMFVFVVDKNEMKIGFSLMNYLGSGKVQVRITVDGDVFAIRTP